MKKVVIVAMALLLSVGLQAQGEKQSNSTKMWVGGNAGFNSSNTKDAESYSQWRFGPTFAYMFNDDMAVGVNLYLNGWTQKQNNNENDIYKNNGWNVELFYRYYFAGAGNFKFFGDGLVNFGGGKMKYESDDTNSNSESKTGNFGIGVRPGFQYWFTPNWSITSTIGYLGYSSYTDNKGETNAAGESTEVKTNDFGINVDFSTVNFSFFYHFQKEIKSI